jgi:hypothetical protein
MTCGILLLAMALASAPGFAADAQFIEEVALQKIVSKDQDYQLMDARDPEMQQIAPLAFSTRYKLNVPITKALVLVVADTDAEALEVARSIPAAEGRAVYAVKGGFEIWQRVIKQAASPAAASKSFVIPKNTCEQGKPIQELKRNKPAAK